MIPDMTLVSAYLANVTMAVKSANCEHAKVLLEQLQQITKPCHVPSSSSMNLSVGVGVAC